MNYLIMPVTELLAGGLFDFNATLPLMAIQFILLTVVLTFVFYKPVGKLLDDRETYINRNLKQASEQLLKADELYKLYEDKLKAAKKDAQTIVAISEKEAKDIVAMEISQARTDAVNLILQTNKELEAQKSIALQKLETQVEELSQLIKDKLLGKELVL